MQNWNLLARRRLQAIVDELRAYGLVGFLQGTISHVWAYNVDRFEPEEIGDTNRSLGVTATENIRELIVRQMRANRPAGLDPRLAATGADNSLLIKAPNGIRLRVMKAAATLELSEPNWEQTEWTSDVRLEAARANHEHYPVGQNDLFTGFLSAEESVDLLGEVFLVWAGGSRSPMTAGWLGFPTIDVVPWLAIEQLWWDKPDGSQHYVSSGGPSDDNDSFSTRPAAEPKIALKPVRRPDQESSGE